MFYERSTGTREWTMNPRRTLREGRLKREDLEGLPTVIIACGSDHVPVRTAKIHTAFREKLLRQMLAGQKVLCNMVLFHCTSCNNRFPTFHRNHEPEFQLECLKQCSIEVAEWYDEPGKPTTRHATLHRGMCMRCRKSLDKVADKPHLSGVATFSAQNNWDPLFGLDTGAAYKEWL